MGHALEGVKEKVKMKEIEVSTRNSLEQNYGKKGEHFITVGVIGGRK